MNLDFIAGHDVMILLLNLCLSAFLTGLIWVIQLVHYPLFLKVGKSQFREYEKSHRKRISVLAMPAMVVDMALSGLLIFTTYYDIYREYILLAFVLNLLAFLSTILFFSRLHSHLAKGYNANLISKLVSINMIRTLIWTARTVVLVLLSLVIIGN